MKKFLSLLLAALLLVSCFTIVNVAAEEDVGSEIMDDDGPGSAAYTAALIADGYTPLGTFEEIVALRGNAEALKGKYYLTADIVVTDIENAMLTGFSGTFDGNGHTIYNAQRTSFDEFTGTVKNIYLSQYKDAAETEPFDTTSPVFGTTLLNGAVIENVISDRIFGMVANYWGSFARGVDSNATVTLIGCVNNTEVSSPYTANNHKLGGFFGCVDGGANVTFKQCINNGKIEGSQVGGFIGTLTQGKGQTIIFEDCLNTGSIEGVIGKGSGESSYGIAGGFIGGSNNAGSKGPVTEQELTISFDGCVNMGNVLRVNKNDPSTKKTKVTSGGLIGNIGTYSDTIGLNLTVKDCFITACVIGGEGWEDLVNSETGEVTKDYTQGHAGAIVGWLDNSKGTNTVDIDGVVVSNVDVKAGDPATASALINTASDTNVVAMKNVFVVGSTYTSVGTGAFTIQNNGTDTNLTVQKAQASTPVDGALKVRFLGGLDNLNYYNVGYMVEKTCDGKTEYFFLETKTVYEAVNNGAAQLTKADFGDRYIVAIPLADLADNKTVEFKVTPYAVSDEDGLLIGATKSVTLTNGVLS